MSETRETWIVLSGHLVLGDGAIRLLSDDGQKFSTQPGLRGEPSQDVLDLLESSEEGEVFTITYTPQQDADHLINTITRYDPSEDPKFMDTVTWLLLQDL